MTDVTASTPRPAGRIWWREAARVLIGAAVVVGAAILLREYFGDLEAWLEGLGAVAPLAYLAIYALAAPLFFPVSVLGFLAGALFGFWQGTLVLVIGGLVAAGIMYVLDRWLVAARIRDLAGRRPRFARFLALAEEDSLKLMILLRLSPLNYGLVCYLLGAAQVRFLPYLLASAFVLPSAALQAWVGYTAREVGRRSLAGDTLGVWQWVLAAVGILAAVVLTILLGRMARRALDATPPAADDDDGGTS